MKTDINSTQNQNPRQPFFYDVTLRDGNQALKNPWSLAEKEIIFDKLVALGVQGIEIGFPASDEMDFIACESLAKRAPENVVVSVLARANDKDIEKAVSAVRHAKKPRIHTFIAMNPLGLEHVLKKDIHTVTKMAVKAVKKAKELLPEAQVEFSVEHFGDCIENLPQVVDAIEKVVEAGADVINLPNTVERYLPTDFTDMVKAVHNRIGDKAIISVHCHNDLGMATATTAMSYFAGATQLETTINGLGERAGNTNMQEVAVALYNKNVNVPLKMEKIQETSLLVSEMSGIQIYEKAPIIGADVLAHRSGIHQDGSNKTKGLKKGQYIAFDPKLIGRADGEHIGFTSQSGKSALFTNFQNLGYPITLQEAEFLMPYAKKMAEEKRSELKTKDLDKLYRTHLCEITGPYKLSSFDRIKDGKFLLSYKKNGNTFEKTGEGNGPINACINAFLALGVAIEVAQYEQKMMKPEDKEAAEALATITVSNQSKSVIARAVDHSTTKASIKAIFNGLNLLSRN
ncbi:MAG: 2-isopropylmalate synthase [Alphaproteobacteria bacterium]|nr:2-isopropylmalate synthase [Alphaproteobacteria bacterium]